MTNNDVDVESNLDRRVDLNTPLEQFSLGLIIGFGLASFPVLFLSGKIWLFEHALLATLIVGIFWWRLDCTYFINGEKKQIEYQRSILGIKSRKVVCKYEDVHSIAVDRGRRVIRKNSSTAGLFSSPYTLVHTAYWVVLILHTGKVIQVSNVFADKYIKADEIARWLKNEIECPIESVGPTQKLNVSWVDGKIFIEAVEDSGRSEWVDHVPTLFGFFISFMAMLLYGGYHGMFKGYY